MSDEVLFFEKKEIVRPASAKRRAVARDSKVRYCQKLNVALFLTHADLKNKEDCRALLRTVVIPFLLIDKDAVVIPDSPKED